LVVPDVAVIVVLPGDTPVARPPALIVAVFDVEDFQVTELVRFCVLASLNVPVAVNCNVAPTLIDELVEVTVIDSRVGVMVSDIVPLTVPDAALIVVLPAATPVARPAELIVAILEAEDFQFAELVRFCLLPSLKTPIAVNCKVDPTAIDDPAALTEIALNVGGGGLLVLEELPPHPREIIADPTMIPSMATSSIPSLNLFLGTIPPSPVQELAYNKYSDTKSRAHRETPG